MTAPERCRDKVLVSHPVHQHAYETAVAAQEAGLLCRFVTGVYYTGNGPMSPRLRRWLPSEVNHRIERELRRRWSPELDVAQVTSIPSSHVAAIGYRRTLGRLPVLSRFDVDTRAHLRFDRAVARRLPALRGLEIVHAFEGSSLATLRSAKRQRLTTVLDVPSAHELFLRAVAAEGGKVRLLRGIDVAAERRLADYLLAPSQFVVDCLVDAGVEAERIVQIPYAVDPSRFRPTAERASTKPFRALFVGQIGLRKGVRYLLEAWRRLDLPDAELVLVGQPDAAGRRVLRDYAGCYRWIGAVPKQQVHAWFQESSVFVFPSLAEGSALVTYEAMASGLPLITTPNSGSVMRDGIDGYLVPPRDIDTLCVALRLLHDQPEQRERMARRARALIEEQYTWRHYRHRLAAFYQAVLERRRFGTHP
jgi:glycosyltransferase involved in cell wall biosynthesis